MVFRDKTFKGFIKVWVTSLDSMLSCAKILLQRLGTSQFIILCSSHRLSCSDYVPLYQWVPSTCLLEVVETSPAKSKLPLSKDKSRSISEFKKVLKNIMKLSDKIFPRRKLLSHLKCHHAKYLVVCAILYVAYVQCYITQLYLVFNTYLSKYNKTERWRSNHMKLLQPNFLFHWNQNNAWIDFQNWNPNFLKLRTEWEFFFFEF